MLGLKLNMLVKGASEAQKVWLLYMLEGCDVMNEKCHFGNPTCFVYTVDIEHFFTYWPSDPSGHDLAVL